jgi:hypothetical protein
MAMGSNAQNNQIKLYLQQIAANQVYIEYLQKGYSIAKKGLTLIGDIKNGHFSLDKDFFASLQTVNPRIKNYAKVADIIAYNISIVQQFKTTLRQARQANLFASEELSYLESVFSNVIAGCTATVDALTVLITSSNIKMSDDERIRRIDALYLEMQDRYVFSNSFCSGLQVQAIQRMKETNDVTVMRGIYGIK